MSRVGGQIPQSSCISLTDKAISGEIRCWRAGWGGVGVTGDGGVSVGAQTGKVHTLN